MTILIKDYNFGILNTIKSKFNDSYVSLIADLNILQSDHSNVYTSTTQQWKVSSVNVYPP